MCLSFSDLLVVDFRATKSALNIANPFKGRLKLLSIVLLGTVTTAVLWGHVLFPITDQKGMDEWTAGSMANFPKHRCPFPCIDL